MRKILGIARKELRSYFASPIACVVIGLFAFVFGWFYVSILNVFIQRSTQTPFQPVDVNQMLIRPLLQNVTVLLLFVLPLVTMRTYAEEKRSGTIELLLTSPVSDFQIILGKFLGAFALYGCMLAVTLIHIGMLFQYGNPEWRPIVTAYLGLVLLGGCFLSVGLLISSLTRNQIVAGMATFAVLLILWVIDSLGMSAGPTAHKILSYVAITRHLDDFVKGILDTASLIYYLSFIAFGLFLTAKAVDSERWRA